MPYSQLLRRTALRASSSLSSFKHLSLAKAPTARPYHAASSVLPSLVSTASPEFQARAKAMDEVVADLEAKLAKAREGGGAKAAERMRNKGKKLPRERCLPFPFPSVLTEWRTCVG